MASPNTNRKESKGSSDLYSTPEIALGELFKHTDINLNGMFFEPCNGVGNISSFMQDQLGVKMVTNELYGHSEADYKEDFLNPNTLASESWNFDYIISNPPYKLGKEFVLEGFKYAKEQYLLLRLQFLEGKARQEDLYKLGHLKTVYVFSYRISCPKGVEQEPQANSVSYCWLHFDRDYNGFPELRWI